MRIILLLFLITILGCQKQEKKIAGFKISGNVKNLNNNDLLVLKFVNDGIELDSISVLNNEFEYSGSVIEPYFVQLLIKDGNSTKGKLTEFMIENTEIIIEGNTVDYDSIQVSGSKSDQILKEYFKKDAVLSSQWDVLKIEYDEYVAINDSINKKLIGEKLNSILKIDRVSLLKKYVKNNSQNVVGALLPKFCSIENVLTEKDYQEMYDTLSQKIKETDYGNSLLEKFNSSSE